MQRDEDAQARAAERRKRGSQREERGGLKFSISALFLSSSFFFFCRRRCPFLSFLRNSQTRRPMLIIMNHHVAAGRLRARRRARPRGARGRQHGLPVSVPFLLSLALSLPLAGMSDVQPDARDSSARPGGREEA